MNKRTNRRDDRVSKVAFAWLLVILAACSSNSRSEQAVEQKEDRSIKASLQGWWLDEVTSNPIFQIKGDTLFYHDAYSVPVCFKVFDDSLKTYGSLTTSYYIEKHNEYTLWIQSVLGEVLHLRKAENEQDSLTFTQYTEKSIPKVVQDDVIRKDRIVYYNNVRYRGYVYINPTQMKVVQPTLSEEGLEVDNVYYDNIIHICIYDGKKELFAKDIRKQVFEAIVPEDFYSRSILSDMDFIGVNAKGYHYQATVCIPNGVSCYLIDLFISREGDITYELAD